MMNTVALAAFREAIRRYLHEAEHAARTGDVTPTQHQLLLAIRGFDAEEPPSISDLSRWLYTKVPSARELVGCAETAGLVTRSSDAVDARPQLVGLTQLRINTLDAFSSSHRAEVAANREELQGRCVLSSHAARRRRATKRSEFDDPAVDDEPTIGGGRHRVAPTSPPPDETPGHGRVSNAWPRTLGETTGPSP